VRFSEACRDSNIFFEARLKTRSLHGQWNPITLDWTPRDRARIKCDASRDFGVGTPVLVNPDRPFAAPTAEELDIARSLNRLDIQLYDKARSRFERIYLTRSAPGSLRSPAGNALGGSV
jgi:hypothetical protein